MNTAQIRAFVAVVDHESFSEAARFLGVSQPAVTMQIQSLEASIGATLLDRGYRRVDLTEAGRVLIPHARRVLEQLEGASEAIAALAGTVTGRLTIAASTTPGVYVIPRLLGTFLAANPEVGVTIAVHDTAQVVEAVEAGTAQLGVTGATVRGARVDFQSLGHDQLVLIAPPGHRFAKRTGLPLTEFAGEQWILRESGSGTRQVAERILKDHGINPDELRVAVELGTGEAVVSAVEGGLGVSIISRLVASKALELGTVIELGALGLPATRPFYTVVPKGTQTRAATAFLDHIVGAL